MRFDAPDDVKDYLRLELRKISDSLEAGEDHKFFTETRAVRQKER